MSDDDAYIRFENITKKFAGVTALDGVSLSIRKGETHALMGENGAGKSTLGKVLAGIYRPDGGELYVGGVERRFGSPRELMSFLGLTVSEYSSGERRRRGSTTKTGNRHARRLLVEAAWHYQHPPRLSARIRAHDGLVPPEALARAWQAQTRLHQRHRHLTGSGKLPNIATVAVARELCGFLWAAMTRQPLQEQPKEVIRAA